MTQTLVVGDVHGCADELDALLDRVGPDRVVLVGDLFTKGPHPTRVWDRVRDGGFAAVLGNHDLRLLEVVDGQRPHDVGGRRVVEDLEAHDPAWLPYVRAMALFHELAAAPWPMVVVHAGLHPSGDRARTTRAMATRMRRFPDEADGSPFWWERYSGDAGVVWGHDARRGLVRRDREGHPWLLGLDTGCVYGGKLTGWVLERDLLVQVDAREAYAPITA